MTLVCPSPADNGEQGRAQDGQIESDAVPPNVFDVVFQALLEGAI